MINLTHATRLTLSHRHFLPSLPHIPRTSQTFSTSASSQWASVYTSDSSTFRALNYCIGGIKDQLLGEQPRLVLVHFGTAHFPFANLLSAQLKLDLKAEVVLGCMVKKGIIGDGKMHLGSNCCKIC